MIEPEELVRVEEESDKTITISASVKPESHRACGLRRQSLLAPAGRCCRGTAVDRAASRGSSRMQVTRRTDGSNISEYELSRRALAGLPTAGTI